VNECVVFWVVELPEHSTKSRLKRTSLSIKEKPAASVLKACQNTISKSLLVQKQKWQVEAVCNLTVTHNIRKQINT